MRLLIPLIFVWSAHAVALDCDVASVKPNQNVVIYLHGAIVTGSGGRPISPEYGPYEYRQILERFRNDGFAVFSEIRTNDSNLQAHADVVAECVRSLVVHGVAERRITVVGASRGGVISSYVSAALPMRNVSYVIISGLGDQESQSDLTLHGRVLSIHDASDKFHIVPEHYQRQSDATEFKIVVTHTGLGHGLLFTPNDAWYLPAKEWITRQRRVVTSDG